MIVAKERQRERERDSSLVFPGAYATQLQRCRSAVARIVKRPHLVRRSDCEKDLKKKHIIDSVVSVFSSSAVAF